MKARRIRRAVARPFFPGSSVYWERHYGRGGDSGLGSSGHLARFKADVVNGFVAELGADSVIEFGCGDGRQLALADYPRYVGLDVSEAAVSRCAARFEDDLSKSFLLYRPTSWHDRAGVLRGDVSLSLDVLFHVVEEELFELALVHLFDAARRGVVIYAPNEARPTAVAYSRPRPFLPWVERHRPDWRLQRQVKNPWPEESWSDFYLFVR